MKHYRLLALVTSSNLSMPNRLSTSSDNELSCCETWDWKQDRMSGTGQSRSESKSNGYTKAA
jgi:hypothetical protein